MLGSGAVVHQCVPVSSAGLVSGGRFSRPVPWGGALATTPLLSPVRVWPGTAVLQHPSATVPMPGRVCGPRRPLTGSSLPVCVGLHEGRAGGRRPGWHRWVLVVWVGCVRVVELGH